MQGSGTYPHGLWDLSPYQSPPVGVSSLCTFHNFGARIGDRLGAAELDAISPASSVWSPTGKIPPVTIYEGKGLKVVIHFSRDAVPGRPTIRVLVASMLSTAPHPFRDIVFQAAVPKVRDSPTCLPELSPDGCIEHLFYAMDGVLGTQGRGAPSPEYFDLQFLHGLP